MIFESIAVGILGILVLYLLAGIRYVSNDRVGVVEKRISFRGSLASGVIARHAEAGYQPDVLRGGLHYRWAIAYAVHTVPLVTIPQGRLGYVFARDGRPLEPGQTLARSFGGIDFQDAASFFTRGGQRGPQRELLREGTYAINLAQFVVLTLDRVHLLPLAGEDTSLFRQMAMLICERDGFRPFVIEGASDELGVVTVHDGPALPPGEIIAPIVGDDVAGHDGFQNPDRFLVVGGTRGRQAQVLVEGTYFVNRLFATIERVPKSVVEVGTVGVVVSYTGSRGDDLSGREYKHGELVRMGERGVWSEPLLPGKYAFNTYAGKIVSVPTTNFILKWSRTESGAHRYDENLTEVSLITRDAFEPSLPLSVVVHIDYRKAPLVVQRFGDVKRLVEQTLDPMVSAYFKNVAQTRTLLQLLHDRSAIQDVSGEEMREKFGRYNLELEEVLIGTPGAGREGSSIESILEQLRRRQIAEEQVATYAVQERASVKERELREAEARAAQQKRLTESEMSIAIQTNEGKAEAQRATQQAEQIRTLANARADEVRALAEAHADETARVGVAQALAIDEQVRAYGGPRYQVMRHTMDRLSDAVRESGVELVPKILIQGAGAAGNASVLEQLLSIVLSSQVGDAEVPNATRRALGEKLEAKLREAIDQPSR